MSNNIINYIITNLSIKGKNFKAICTEINLPGIKFLQVLQYCS